MTRENFISRITDIVNNYITYYIGPKRDFQVKVNPETLYTVLVDTVDQDNSIEYSDEAVEEAAAADSAEYEDAMDGQSRRNPDFYALRSLIKTDAEGKSTPDVEAIAKIADTYFKKA